MSFPKYPKYKESGVEWLGQVPEQWAIKRLQLVASFESGMAHEPYIDDSGEFICVNSRFVSTGGETKKLCTKNLSPAKKNDVLIVMSDLPKGRALAKAFFVLDDTPYAVNQRVGIITPRATHSRFLFYYLDRNPGFLLHDDGLNQTHLWNDLFKKFPTPFPPLPKQIAIASFLDRETAKIDALVAEQKRLIELLKEKRQAVISHAVTKGLNPNAKMKPSGIEWLGDVPEWWDYAPLKYLAEIQAGYAFSSDDFVAEGIPLLRIGDITPEGGIDFTNARYLPAKYQSEHLDVVVLQGDIVMAMTGATIGKAGRYASTQPALLNQRVCIFRALAPNSQQYLWHIFGTRFYNEHITLTAFGGAQPNISETQLLQCVVPLPPKTDQIAIAEFLDSEINKFNSLTAEAQQAIDLLQERRAALISAAVTGQIDVRGLVPSAAA